MEGPPSHLTQWQAPHQCEPATGRVTSPAVILAPKISGCSWPLTDDGPISKRKLLGRLAQEEEHKLRQTGTQAVWKPAGALMEKAWRCPHHQRLQRLIWWFHKLNGIVLVICFCAHLFLLKVILEIWHFWNVIYCLTFLKQTWIFIYWLTKAAKDWELNH